ncbi:hypothetical protein HK104_004963, partial [Borealophlyctis nickersoniae]
MREDKGKGRTEVGKVSARRDQKKMVRFADFVKDSKAFFKEIGDLTLMSEQEPMQLLMEGIEASSEDDEHQTIACTLDDSSRNFWSSKGSPDNTTSEYLIYKMVQPICVVTRVEVVPYKARYQRGMPIYAPRSVAVSVGFHQEAENMHYVSEEFPVENSNVTHTFNIKPTLVVGGFLRLDLRGRYQRQPGDNLFYTVLESVKCFGLPIGAFLNKPHVTAPLLSLASTFGAPFHLWSTSSTFSPDSLEGDISRALAARRNTAMVANGLAELVAQGRWKQALRVVTGFDLTSHLRSQERLTWMFENAWGDGE